MRILIAYVVGTIFGLGISISGMANPAKVLNFFDVAGTWDPSLAFVMGGALVVTFIGYRFILPRPAGPMFEQRFLLPGSKHIDGKLIGGAVLFGVGWGISGFCPGGVLPVLGTGKIEVILFVVAMVAGIFAARAMMNFRRPATPTQA